MVVSVLQGRKQRHQKVMSQTLDGGLVVELRLERVVEMHS